MRELLESKVAVPAVLRVLLAIVIVIGGLLSALLGAMFLIWMPAIPAPHPVSAALLKVGMIALGAGFMWIGLRLMRRRADSENLLSPTARRRSSFIVGAFGVFMVMGAVESKNEWFFLGAAGCVLFSYWLFPLKSH